MIVYFSGTGNSLAVAKTLAHENEQIIPVTALENAERQNDGRLGFVFPVYWYGLPTVCVQALKQAKLPKTGYAFACFTFNSGIGDALIMLSDLLKEKGIVLNAAFSVHMPNNYVPMLPLQRQNTVERLLTDAKTRVQSKLPLLAQHKTFVDVQYGLAKPLSPWLYKFYLKNRRVDKFYVTPACTGCGLCARVCPTGAISMNGTPTWQGECCRCLACLHRCPVQAVQLGRNTKNRGRYTCPKDTL